MATNISTDTVTTSNVVVSPQTNKPGSPTEGQIISGTGTGDIAKGVYRYTGGSWESLDNAQGDLNTLRLIMSTDTNANDFNAAKSSTSVAGNTNAVPHETSTGTGMLGALEIPSTGGDALLTEFDANRVLRYYSAGADNNNDYFGITVDVPAWCRGQNIVVEFQYRTEEASAATSNGDFQLSVWDKTNGVSTTQASTLTTGTTISAGSNILMTAKTNLAVGDKIWFETGGTGSTVGGVANDFTEAYITEISSTDNNIKVSQDVQVIALGKAVTGWLSSKVEGLLPEADSDTDKVGKSYSLQVKTAADTAQINLYWSNKSTTTNVIELFFDGILISANKFLQASSQTKSEYYGCPRTADFWDTATANDQWDFNLLNPGPDTPILAESKLITIDDYNGDTQTRIYAKQNIILAASVFSLPSNSCWISIFDSTDNHLQLTHAAGDHAGVPLESSTTIKLAKDDYIYFYQNNSADRFGAAQIVATPQTSDVILLESQDQIFTDWQEYSPTSEGMGTLHADTKVFWRRVGSNMEITGFIRMGTVSSTAAARLGLPSGYSLNPNIGGGDQRQIYGYYFLNNGANNFYSNNNSQIGVLGYEPTSGGVTTLMITGNSKNDQDFQDNVANTYFGTDQSIMFNVSVPIQGWNANFNPLLSMPLVDFGTYDNFFTAKLETSTTTSAVTITEQSPTSWIDSAANVSAGIWSIDYTSLGLANPPVLTFQVNHIALICSVPTLTNTGAQYKLYNPYSDVFHYGIVWVKMEKVGSDRVPLPQATAAIIKPAVATLKDKKAANTSPGTQGTAAWVTRTLNTIEGESWFVTATGTMGLTGTNTNFTLEAGTYEFFALVPQYQGANSTAKLTNVTDSTTQIKGQSAYFNTSDNGAGQIPIVGSFTITASTEFKIEHYVGGACYLGVETGPSTGDEVFTQAQIRKLK